MHTRVLNQIREKIRTRDYIMTLHAEEEMDADGFTIFEVEHVLLNGHIIEKQKDAVTAESKYVVHGQTIVFEGMFVVCKISPTGKLVILTIYAEGE